MQPAAEQPAGQNDVNTPGVSYVRLRQSLKKRPKTSRKFSIPAALYLLAYAVYWYGSRSMDFDVWLQFKAYTLGLIHFDDITDAKADLKLIERHRKTVEPFLSWAPLLGGAVAQVDDVEIPVKGARIPLRIYRPLPSTQTTWASRPGQAAPLLPVLVWTHGGGWIMAGNITKPGYPDNVCRDLARQSGMIVVSVGYRLAPENQFPVPLDDCVAAVQWVHKNIRPYGGDPAVIAVGGDSAGGNLALSTALVVAGKPKLCALFVTCPQTDFQTMKDIKGSYATHRSSVIPDHAGMAQAWHLYLPTEADGADWRASPLRAPPKVLGKAPPTLIQVAEHDVLSDEAVEMGARFREAGADATVSFWNKTQHGFFARTNTGGLESLQEASSFLSAHCSGPQTFPGSAALPQGGLVLHPRPRWNSWGSVVGAGFAAALTVLLFPIGLYTY